jgi:hypothetical protein
MPDIRKPRGKDDGKASQRQIKTSIRLRTDLWRQAKIMAMDQGVDLQTIVGLALISYLEKR